MEKATQMGFTNAVTRQIIEQLIKKNRRNKMIDYLMKYFLCITGSIGIVAIVWHPDIRYLSTAILAVGVYTILEAIRN